MPNAAKITFFSVVGNDDCTSLFVPPPLDDVGNSSERLVVVVGGFSAVLTNAF
jgi:hypothetical protein